MSDLTIFGAAGGPGSMAILEILYVRGDDDDLVYSAGLSFDSGLGIYLWSVGLHGSDMPRNTVNISDRVIGSAFFMRDGDEDWHTFMMTPTDPPIFGYVWTDYAQSASTPVAASRRRIARCDNGLYVIDSAGEQIHKMGVTGGLWSELNQGYNFNDLRAA